MTVKTSNHYANLRRMILASMILVPFIPFIFILGIGYYYFNTSLKTNTISGMERIVEDHRLMIESFLRERKANLEFIINAYTFQDLKKEKELAEIFDHLQRESNAFVDLGVFNENGLHVAYQGPYKLEGKIYRTAPWFKAVIRQGSYMSDVFLGYRRVPHFVIALISEDHGEKWVIRATIDTHLFNDLVKKVRIGKTGEAYLINTGGIFQTERRSGGNLLEKDPDHPEITASHDGIRTFIHTDIRGNKYLYATTWLRDKRWQLVVRQEKEDAFRALRSASYLILLIILIGGAIIAGIAFYLTDRIVRRMEYMDGEKERLGQQLIRASRLAELGEMAAGFAHEINNPLQIIKSEQSLIEAILSDLKGAGDMKESEDLSELEDSMAQIKLQVDRCAQITQAILKFGRKTEKVIQDVQLRDFIPEVAAMVEKKAVVEGITIHQDVSNGTPPIRADPTQLQQVLLNLFNNGIDAILAKEGNEGGQLDVMVCPKDDGSVKMTVRDNGCGISPENLKRIFTPFFTTKPVGKGTGLGLSVCYGIIDSMGGIMEVSSREGEGTTFTITLPGTGH
ncbi:MAG: two-component sensor histidine kinase [Deltaproteobacteria bacterium]|nr:two-component sensor histidine kinase [Deltaproteobacteria bacterium]